MRKPPDFTGLIRSFDELAAIARDLGLGEGEAVSGLRAVLGLRWSLFAAGAIPVVLVLWGWAEVKP